MRRIWRRFPVVAPAVIALVAGACSYIADVDTAPEAHVLATPPDRDVPGDASLVNGRALYGEFCAACHGEEGRGGYGPNLRTESLLADRYQAVFEQVLEGQGDMPSFDVLLGDAAIRDIAAYVVQRIAVDDVHLGSGAAAGEGGGPTSPPPGIDLGDGRDQYRASCASCHGRDGQGTGVGPAIQGVDSYGAVIGVLRSGADGMPSFLPLLTAAQRQAVAAYVAQQLGQE